MYQETLTESTLKRLIDLGVGIMRGRGLELACGMRVELCNFSMKQQIDIVILEQGAGHRSEDFE